MVHERHERHEKKTDGILFKEESFRLLGACFQVYKDKGCGFHESVYEECLKIEFELQRIPAIERPAIELEYKGVKLTRTYIPDFVCFGGIIVELKALPNLSKDHEAQVMNYLKATGMRLGLLANFGHFPLLEHRRITAHDSWSQQDAPLEEEPDFHS